MLPIGSNQVQATTTCFAAEQKYEIRTGRVIEAFDNLKNKIR